MVYVEVILNTTAQNLDRPFLYQTKESLRIKTGDLVMVPFGGGNRTTQGFVIGVTDELPLDTPKGKDGLIKEVLRVVTRGILDDDDFALISFMRLRYLSSWMEAIRLLIPKGKLSGVGHKYRQVLVSIKKE